MPYRNAERIDDRQEALRLLAPELRTGMSLEDGRLQEREGEDKAAALLPLESGELAGPRIQLLGSLVRRGRHRGELLLHEVELAGTELEPGLDQRTRLEGFDPCLDGRQVPVPGERVILVGGR